MEHTLNLAGLDYRDKYRSIEQAIRSFNRENFVPVKATFYFKEETKIELFWHLKAIQALWTKKITLKMISHASCGTLFSKVDTTRSYRALSDFPVGSVSKVVLTTLETDFNQNLKTLTTLWERKHDSTWNHLNPEEIAEQFPKIVPFEFARYFSPQVLEDCNTCLMMAEEFRFESRFRNRIFELVGEYGPDQLYRTWVIETDTTTKKAHQYFLLNLNAAFYYRTN